MAHPVMWFEVLGSDGNTLRQFYGGLFGWRFGANDPIESGEFARGRAASASRV